MAMQQRLETLARLGFAARGLVYVLVGWFAFSAARGAGDPQGSQGAIASLGQSTLGQLLLVLIALGLLGYGVWRIANAWVATGDGEGGREGTAVRLGHALSGAAHILLAGFAASLLLGGGGAGAGGGEGQTQDIVARVLAWPLGEATVIAVGLGLIAAGIAQLVKAWRASFMTHIGATGGAREGVEWIGRLGYAARAIVFAFAGMLFVQAGLASDPAQTGGMGEMLARLERQDNGTLLLSLVGIGLLLFGLFSFVLARYRTVRVPDPRRGSV